ncbi:hypothetical protein [Staphylothermus hellenicus]|uniref:Uncharacterized protein n=1 Tax=Staphylothermus hellenicus (strain DSM 12710 / JCM 10830 / BK20S6-10-b1 / P8) TaxID=591019 RepID=D7D915_STAHD|nr:hypothetical protein [Staphylothermus hellenicus]ADI32261.1 hypothetical protein Shell_1160 [Staphylothermus hellenicus DSM 12710]
MEINNNKLHQMLKKRLLEVLKILQDKSREQPMFNQLVQKLKNEYEELSKVSPTPIISKYQVDLFMHIIKYLEELVKLVNNKEISTEEINVVIRDLDRSIKDYISVLKKDMLRSKIMFHSPIYLAFIIYLINLIITSNTQGQLIINTIITLIGGIALVLSMIRLDYAYVAILASAIIGLFSLSYFINKLTSQNLYIAMIYILIIISATTYFQLLKTTRSKTYQDRIQTIISNIMDLTKKLSENKSQTITEKTSELMDKLLEKYREIYGVDGEALLKYKLNVLIMHGYSREEAIKKLFNELSEK